MNKLLALLLMFFALQSAAISKPVTIQSEGMQLKLEQVAEGLSVPWGMSFISATQLLLSERDGNVKLLDVTSGDITLLKNTPEVLAAGQGGMLDVAASPDYKKDGWIYFTYVKDVDIDSEGAIVLARAQLLNDSFTNWQELLLTKSATEETFHFGSRISFDAKGHVYFGIGDRGVRENSQNLKNHAGSIMRLNLDGSVPSDNPFAKNKKFLPEV